MNTTDLSEEKYSNENNIYKNTMNSDFTQGLIQAISHFRENEN